MGETFFLELAHRKYPPEVRQALNEMALEQARQVVIMGGKSKGVYPIGEEWRPTLGVDLFVRVGQEVSMGVGIAPRFVDLQPRPNLQQLVERLQPELRALIGARR